MSNKNCDICNREKARPYGKTPTDWYVNEIDVYLNDIFVVVDCDCGKELVVCEDCLDRSYNKLRCKSCNRDKKIEDLL